MKIIYEMLVYIVTFASIIMLLTSCSFDFDKNDNTVSQTDTQTENTNIGVESWNSENNNGDPSYSLEFNSIIDLNEFLNSTEKKESDFNEYIKENDLYSCGIRNKQDVEMCKKIIESKHIPVCKSESYEFCMEFDPSSKIIDIMYSIDDTIYRFVFLEDYTVADRTGTYPICECMIDGETVGFYEMSEGEDSKYYVSNIYREDYAILISVYRAEADNLSFDLFDFK